MRTRSTLIVLIAAVVAVMSFPALASAYCGPGFSTKSSAVAYYNGSGKSMVPSMTKWLRSHNIMQADQSFNSFITSDRVENVVTPKGYTLNANTFCSGTSINPYDGKYAHGGKNVLAIRVGKSTKMVGKSGKSTTTKVVVGTTQVDEKNPDGSTSTYAMVTIKETTTYKQKYKTCKKYKPFMKGYCRNLVSGKPFKKCKTKVRTVRKVRTYQEKHFVGNVPGISQSQSAEQECKLQGKFWNSEVRQCEIIQVQVVCGVVVVNGGTVNTGDICPTKTPSCEETNTCPIPPPPPPKCPDGRPVPENGDCDRAPSITITSIPHLMAPNAEGRGAENGFVYMETSDPDGDVQNADVEVVSGGEFANWTSLIETNQRWNQDPCPSGKTCWRFTLWAKAPGNFQFRGIVSAGGKTVKSAISTVEVQPFQF